MPDNKKKETANDSKRESKPVIKHITVIGFKNKSSSENEKITNNKSKKK
jgi:hypothetical protein